ncbi:MAG: GNAT family N-acetyltransferase [Bacteroidetes bacterium]|nr:GNAT family N-acetyltransferase [Bacteroidota bacterium]
MQIDIVNATLEDHTLLGSIFFNEEVVRFTNFKKFGKQSELKIFFQKFIHIHAGEALQYGPYLILADHQIAGLCGMQQLDLEKGVSEIWYVLAEPFWGKGIATFILKQLIEMAESNPLMNSIYAEAVSSNQASWQLLEKAGFTLIQEKENGFVKGDIKENLRCYELKL